MSWFLTVETLIVLHEFCTFFSVMGLPRADFICNNGVNIHGISSLGSGVVPSFGILFYSKGLVKLSTCIWAVGSSLVPLAMLFLGFLCPSFKCPGGKRIIGVGGYDDVKESSLEP
jgi:cytosine/uracil/thiamine/allantoin permease